MSYSFKSLIVGVSDLRPVEALWLKRFGLEIAARVDRPDSELARVWSLPPDSIARQLLLRTPGADNGWLHFVEFVKPAAPVRRGAAATDLCPKNLDVICADMPARRDELLEDGFAFRSDISEYEIGDMQAREVQMPAHDDTNVVLIEVFDWSVGLSSKQYGAVTSLVIVVPDTQAEASFYSTLFGLEELMHHRIAGPEIEQVIGLPPGAALDMRLLGNAAEPYGRIELIRYEQLTGANLFPLARPPATGTLGCRFRVADADGFVAQAAAAGIATVDHGVAELIFGRVRLLSVLSPAGMRVEVYESL